MSFSALMNSIIRHNEGLRRGTSQSFKKEKEYASERQSSKERNVERMEKADQFKKRKVIKELVFCFGLILSVFWILY